MAENNLKTNSYEVQAGKDLPIPCYGSFAFCIDSDAVSSGDLKLIIGGSGNKLRFDQGDKHRLPQGQNFTELTLSNSSASDIVVTVGFGDGDIETAQQVSISGTVDTSIRSGTSLTTATDATVADATKEQVLAANATRKSAVIKSLRANTAEVRVGDTNIDAARGHELCEGETITLDTTAAIFIRNDSGAPQTFSIVEISA